MKPITQLSKSSLIRQRNQLRNSPVQNGWVQAMLAKIETRLAELQGESKEKTMPYPNWKKMSKWYANPNPMVTLAFAYDGNADYVQVFWEGSQRKSIVRADRLKAAPTNEPTIYPDLASAQEAMDRGETVRIEFYPWEINPDLLRLARHLQDKEHLEEWRNEQRLAGER